MASFILDTIGVRNIVTDNNSIPIYQKEKKLLAECAQLKLKNGAKFYHSDSDNNGEEDDDFFQLPLPNVDLTEIIKTTLTATKECRSQIVQELQEVTERVNDAIRNAENFRQPYSIRKRIVNIDHSNFNKNTGKLDDESFIRTDVTKELETTKCVPGLEQLKGLPKLSKQQRRKQNKQIRAESKGADWFDLPATEITNEVRNELKIIQMRSVLDPKHFYKKNDLKVLPKYFQIGTVQSSALDHYNERNMRKTKKSLVDELLQDQEFQKFNKRKYNEVIMRTNKYAQRKAMKKLKQLKKKN